MKVCCKHDRMVQPGLLKPHPKNPNKHTVKDGRKMIKLLRYYGWRHPIIVSNLSGCVVAGHLRLMAALMDEMEFIPVVFQDFETEDEEYGFLVADNASQEWSKMDLAMVNLEVENLGLGDIDLLGIDGFEIDPVVPAEPNGKKPKICPHCGGDVNAAV